MFSISNVTLIYKLLLTKRCHKHFATLHVYLIYMHTNQQPTDRSHNSAKYLPITWPSSSFKLEVRAMAGVSVASQYISKSCRHKAHFHKEQHLQHVIQHEMSLHQRRNICSFIQTMKVNQHDYLYTTEAMTKEQLICFISVCHSKYQFEKTTCSIKTAPSNR